MRTPRTRPPSPPASASPPSCGRRRRRTGDTLRGTSRRNSQIAISPPQARVCASPTMDHAPGQPPTLAQERLPRESRVPRRGLKERPPSRAGWHTDRHAPRGISAQARLRYDAGTRPGPGDRRERPDRPLRRAAPPGHETPLRRPPGDRWRPRLLGGPEGPDPGPQDRDGWPSTSRTTRSSTSTSRASSPRSSTGRATSSSGTGAPGSPRPRPLTPGRPSRRASSSSACAARSSRAGSPSSGPAVAPAARPAPRSRTTTASNGCSSTSATSTHSPAGMRRTIHRASRPGAPTMRSRPTATRSGSARCRPPRPRSTSRVQSLRRSPCASSRCWRPSPASRSPTRTGCSRSSGTGSACRPWSMAGRSGPGPAISRTPRRTSPDC